MDRSVKSLKEKQAWLKVSEQATEQQLLSPKTVEVYQLFFLEDNKNQDVEVVETEQIDFTEVVQRLKQGDSIFMKIKNLTETKPSSKLIEDVKRPLFFFYI